MKVKPGDLIYVPEWSSSGLIITWIRTGGPDDTIWEVLLDNGDLDILFESDMEVIGEM